MALETIIDLVLAALLLAAIGSSFMLHRRIEIFRQGHAELASLVDQLNKATNQAQASVAEMKSNGTLVEEHLKSEIARARALADELSLITEAGDSLADRLEKRLTGTGAVIAAASQSPGEEEEGAGNPAVFTALKEAR